MRVKTVFFDLDGTLWAPHSVVLPAFRQVFLELGSLVPADETLLDTLGYPIDEIWLRLLPESDAATRELANHMMGRAEMALIAAGWGSPFSGVANTLAALSSAGCALYILSNCQSEYLQVVPDALGIGQYFTGRFCAGGFPGLSKAEILAKVLPTVQLPAAMIGDRWHDIAAGKQNGLLAIGCSYGLGRDQELAEADSLIRSFPELLSILG